MASPKSDRDALRAMNKPANTSAGGAESSSNSEHHMRDLEEQDPARHNAHDENEKIPSRSFHRVGQIVLAVQVALIDKMLQNEQLSHDKRNKYIEARGRAMQVIDTADEVKEIAQLRTDAERAGAEPESSKAACDRLERLRKELAHQVEKFNKEVDEKLENLHI